MHHHHHGGGWPSWMSGYVPIAYNDFPRYAIQQEVIEVPDWALFTGLGLLAVLAFGGRK